MSFSLSHLVSGLSALACVGSVLAVPAPTPLLDVQTREVTRRSTPAAPHFVVYSDKWVSGENGPPDPSEIEVLRGSSIASTMTNT